MKILSLLTFLIAHFHFAGAQISEVIFNNDDEPRPFSAASFDDGRVLFSSYELFQTSAAQVTPEDNKLFLLDTNLSKLDSIVVDQELNLSNSSSLCMANYQDSLIIVGVQSYKTGVRSIKDYHFLFINSNLSIKDTISIKVDDRFSVGLYDIKINNNWLFASIFDFQNGIIHPGLITIDLKNKNILSDTTFRNINNPSLNIFSGILKINNSYYFGDADVTSPNQFYKLNSELKIVEEISRDSIKVFGGISHSIGTDILIQGANDQLYFTGTYGREWLLLGKTDTSFSKFRLDTFGIDCIQHPVVPSACFSETNRNFLGYHDYRTPDSLFLMTGQGEYNFHNIEYRVENNMRVQSDIFVYNVDTSGQVNWRKEIAQDSVYFHPWELVATPDGGALVFSSKYDPRYKKEYHLRISIIKIDRFGNIVGEQEFAAPRAQWSVYPNPAKGKVHITGLPDAHLRKKVVLMDLSGKTVLEQQYKNGEDLQLPAALQGPYLLQVQNENGRRLGVRKVMVE